MEQRTIRIYGREFKTKDGKKFVRYSYTKDGIEFYQIRFTQDPNKNRIY